VNVWIYVEGESDKLSLFALVEGCGWKQRLRQSGWGLQIISLNDKANYLKKIGARASQKLIDSEGDVVVGLPDLYPMATYAGTNFAHSSADELARLQERLLLQSLESDFDVRESAPFLQRFCGSCLKHDLEVLLLAAEDELRAYLKASGSLGNWRQIVEDQNDGDPPKRVIERIFRTKSEKRISYRDTVHAPAVLRQVAPLSKLYSTPHGQLRCPVFKRTVDWIVQKTGIAAG
jgi:hypothetical protein